MSEMKHVVFSQNATHTDGMAGASLMLMLTGSFGGGELLVQRYSAARGDFVTVSIYAAATATAEEVKLGQGAKVRLQLSGATTPSLNIDYWFV